MGTKRQKRQRAVPTGGGGPLAGIRVVDLTSHVSGPYCTMILADLGAEVTKVERPGSGDDARAMPPHVAGESVPFMIVNRGKRSIALDLKRKDDLALCRKLVADADVFVENFKPGTAAKIGLGWPTLRRLNPRLIYCSVSGFGQSGPWSARGGFDLMTQALSGIMSVTGAADGPPHRVPMPISDIGAGLQAAVGVLAALLARQRTAKGQRVDVSLYDSALAFGLYEAAHYFATGEPPPKLGQAHRGSSPYQVFRTQDGWITIGAAAQHLWQRLCTGLGRGDLLADPRFASNAGRVRGRAALVAILEAEIAKRPTAAWETFLAVHDIPYGRVQGYDEVLEGEHTRARGMVVALKHPRAGATRVLGNPVKLSVTPARVVRPAPVLDQHGPDIRKAAEKAETRGRKATKPLRGQRKSA